MLENKYTVTFKFAKRETEYVYEDGKKGSSSLGHIWYVIQKNTNESYSFGFTRKISEGVVLLNPVRLPKEMMLDIIQLEFLV